MPPAKKRLNNSSGEISSSNMGPRPADGDLAKPPNEDAPAADPGPNRLSGSPPNRSNLAFLSASDKT